MYEGWQDRKETILIFPSQQAPGAGLSFGHLGEGNREEFVNEAIILTRLGFVSLCLDAPFRRPVEYEPQITEPLPRATIKAHPAPLHHPRPYGC